MLKPVAPLMGMPPAWCGQGVWSGLTLCYPPQRVIMCAGRGLSDNIPGAPWAAELGGAGATPGTAGSPGSCGDPHWCQWG